MKNVAIFGPMYAGKSTIADALAAAGYHRMSFAAPLKNVAALAYGPVDKGATYTVVNQDNFEQDVTGRQILQGVGQLIKGVDRDFWMKCFFRDAANYLDMPLVVDDGRFWFEYAQLAARGWLTVGVLTPDSIRDRRAMALSGRLPKPEERNHASEQDIPEILASVDLKVDGTRDPYENARSILELARKT